VNLEIKSLDWTYTGTLSPDGNSIAGSRTQGGQALVLNLQRVSAENTWAIPEPPKAMPADAKPKFDVVTVKPSDPNRPGNLFTVRGRHVMTINTNVDDLITFAYGLHPRQIVDGPEWFGTDKFDIDGVPDVEGQPTNQQLRLLMQDVLERRFGLKFHHDQRELAVYSLTVGKSGPKMTVTASPPSGANNFLLRGRGGDLMVTNATMKDFCNGMQEAVMDKPVVDHTGLKDRYDFTLKWTADDSQFAQMGMRPPAPTDDPNAPPSLYTAIQEQLGLKLDSVKTMADVVVIDKVEKPSAN
jgi:uncharacterized protein (TIGR03435 family)